MAETTFIPDAAPESTCVDGHVIESQGGAGDTWANIRGGAGNNSFDQQANADVELDASTTTDQYNSIERIALLFDTSSIPDGDTINSAKLRVYVESKTDNFSQSICVVKPSPASNTALVNADYANANWDTTLQSDDSPTLASVTTSAYLEFDLNATGIANINDTGITKLGLMLSGDQSNTAPTWSSGLIATLRITTADGTAGQRPELVVNHGEVFTPLAIIM